MLPHDGFIAEGASLSGLPPLFMQGHHSQLSAQCEGGSPACFVGLSGVVDKLEPINRDSSLDLERDELREKCQGRRESKARRRKGYRPSSYFLAPEGVPGSKLFPADRWTPR
mgnify:CR=1 FL=1